MFEWDIIKFFSFEDPKKIIVTKDADKIIYYEPCGNIAFIEHEIK